MYACVVRKFKNLTFKEIRTKFLFLAVYHHKIALLSANQNEAIYYDLKTKRGITPK